MAKALSKRTIDALKAEGGKAAFAWCKVVPGFGVKASPGGGVSFIYQYRAGSGRAAAKRRLTIGRYGELTVDQARDIARGWALDVAHGKDPGLAKVETEVVTVAALVDRWASGPARMNRRTGAARDAANVKIDVDRLAAHVLPILGQRPAASITKKDIEALRDRITSGATAKTEASGRLRGVRRIEGGAGTAARTLRVLQSVFAFAIDEGIAQVNPVVGVRREPDQKSERFLSTEEAARLAASLDAWEVGGGNPLAANVVRGLMLTGCRLSEVSALRWSEVDFERGFLRLEATKAGKSTRPLSAPALAFFAGVPRLCPVYVFPATRGAADGPAPFQGTPKAWRAIREAAGMPDLRLHDLRHSYASFAAAAGVPLVTIGKLLGHASPTTTARYAHLAEDAARRGADLAAAQLANALGIGTADRSGVIDLADRRA